MGNMTSLSFCSRLLGRQAGQGFPLFEVHLPFLRESIIVRDFQQSVRRTDCLSRLEAALLFTCRLIACHSSIECRDKKGTIIKVGARGPGRARRSSHTLEGISESLSKQACLVPSVRSLAKGIFEQWVGVFHPWGARHRGEGHDADGGVAKAPPVSLPLAWKEETLRSFLNAE